METRRLSGGISIGTGLVLESIFKVPNRYDPDREPPNKVKIGDYDYHVFNLHTIIRNVLNSLPPDNDGLKEKDLKNLIVDDINTLNEYYKDVDTTPLILWSDYTKLELKYNSIGKDNDKVSTSLFKLYELNNYIKSLEIDKIKSLEMGVFKSGTPVGDSKILLTSSFLLDIPILGDVDLLESHTGVFKNKYKYNTKFKPVGKNDISHIPYNDLTHKVLGDKTFVKPANLAVRRELIKISEKWTPRTTRGTVADAFLKHPDLKEYIRT